MPQKTIEIRWTQPAVDDLDHIEAYIAHDDPVKAASFILMLIETIETILPEYPGAGKAGRILGTRELVIHENYLVPYRVIGNTLEILRVLHVARQWPAG